MSSTPSTDPSPDNTVFGFPVGRVVAFLSPYVSILSGLLAAWLFTHFPGLHVLGSQAGAERMIMEGAIWVVTTVVSYAIHHKWLDGLSKWERGVVSDMPGDLSVVVPPDDSTGLPDEPTSSALGMRTRG